MCRIAGAPSILGFPARLASHCALLWVVLFTTWIEAAGRVTVTPTVPTAVEEATLFSFDDISIPHTYNLYLSMHPAQKHPDNPVLYTTS